MIKFLLSWKALLGSLAFLGGLYWLGEEANKISLKREQRKRS